MRRLLPALLVLAAVSAGQQEVAFGALDVYVDAGDRPLAAYQVEMEAPGALIVGVEGGEPEPFRPAPYYDPAALKGGRIILAAFTTSRQPPRGRVRVARVHFQHGGVLEGKARLIVAAVPGGERVAAEVEVVPFGEKR